MSGRERCFRSHGVAVLRAAARTSLGLPPLPDLMSASCDSEAVTLWRAASADPDGQPLAVDRRLDATVTLPSQVAEEIERAAWALIRLSARPFGTPAWKAWHNRTYERYGIGALVPVLDAVADSGIGFRRRRGGGVPRVTGPRDRGGSSRRWIREWRAV